MYPPAREPNDLEKFFVERANGGDLEGLVALYEPQATLSCNDGRVFIGLDQIRRFLVDFLARQPTLTPGDQAPALASGDIALTSSRHANGEVSAEVARRQSDGHWLWVVDRFAVGGQVFERGTK